MSWHRQDGSQATLEGKNLRMTVIKKGDRHEEVIRWHQSVRLLGETLHAQGFVRVN